MENNKLIAEFMGVKFDKGTFYNMGYDIFSNGNLYRSHELKYHTDWDWLMPVVNRILFIKPDFEYVANLEVTYPTVVEFIKQYNENERLNKDYISYNDAPYGQD